jgi:Bacterial SH3 domain
MFATTALLDFETRGDVMRTKALITTVSILASSVASAETPVPSDYTILLGAQRSCDASPWKQVNWEPEFVKNGGSVELNPFGEWTIQEGVSISSSAVKVDIKKKYSKREFKISTRGWGYFSCKSDEAASVLYPKPRKFTWTVQTDVRHVTGYQGIAAPPHPLLRESSEEKRPQDGWKCYSEYSDFLRDPSIVDVEKLCAGQDEAKKQEVRNEILRVADVLREKRYSECKKKKPHLAALPSGGKAWIDGPANVRAKNSATAAIVMELADDVQVDVVQQKGSWFLIKSDGKQGWTAKQNLLPQSVRAECRDWERSQ